MRVSVPTIPTVISATPAKQHSRIEAIERVASFLAPGNAAVLTGAGVSVDSGIRAYRGKDGRYMNPNYKPIFYHELMDAREKGHAFRQRYWLRSYLGYPPVRDTLPNTTHFAIAALQHSSLVSRLVTQNVDGLHEKAVAKIWKPPRIREQILELHGTLHRVHCKHGHTIDRDTFQDRLSEANPQWKAFADDLEQTGSQPRTNPDGDVALDGVTYDDFVVPECPECLLEDRRCSVLKPEVIFFGESIPKEVKDRSFADIELCDRLFVVGTTLATYSAFRLIKHALELKKPILLLNVGPTRADGLAGIEKIDVPSGSIIREVVKTVLGLRSSEDPVLKELLSSGIVKPPIDDDDRAPRAAE
ncbi:hypothetical protein PLICRDRAFT_42959 [Plicaturopsis crispa FD-325 SS-3]|nr:hypothetical protein PLICRDRAFT_42959 [Plicaturopsis crispa FD-325 SS-3]